MASNYPTSLDNFTNPTSNDSLNSPSHSLQHADANDAIEALQRKVGIGSSTAGSATSGQVLTAGTGGTTTWQTLTIPTPGLSLIAQNTFSGVTTVTVDNVFDATYDNYRVIFFGYGSSNNSAVFLQFLNTSGTAITSGYYSAASQTDFGGGGGLGHLFNTGGWTLTYLNNGDTSRSAAVIDIFSPFLAVNTVGNGLGTGINSGAAYQGGFTNCIYTAATQFRGFRFANGAGTNMTGNYKVYGYRNS